MHEKMQVLLEKNDSDRLKFDSLRSGGIKSASNRLELTKHLDSF